MSNNDINLPLPSKSDINSLYSWNTIFTKSMMNFIEEEGGFQKITKEEYEKLALKPLTEARETGNIRGLKAALRDNIKTLRELSKPQLSILRKRLLENGFE